MVINKFSHTADTTTHPIEAIKEFIKDNALKVFLSLMAAYALGTLFAAGVVLTIISLAVQYDANLPLRLTAILAAGLSITLATLFLFCIGIYYSKRNKREKKKEKRREQEFSLQESLMLLVNDFIKEREFKRSHAEEYQKRNNETKNTNDYPDENLNEEMRRH